MRRTAVNPARKPEEHLVERSYDKVRIYHRYRIPGLREKMRTGLLRANRQDFLRFTPYEEQVAIIESLWSDEQPAKEIWVQRFQKLIDEDASQVESSLQIRMPQRYPGFTEYFAEHEERVKGTFHVLSATVTNPIQVFRFGVYNAQGGTSDIFLLTPRGEIADSFLKRFVHQGVIASYTPIDLQKLAASGTTKVRGGSFHIRGRPTLTTATIYGPEVNQNEMWADLSTNGTLQFVQLQLVTGDREITLRVSNRGSLMPFGIDDVREQLALVTEIYDKYVKQFEKPEVLLR
jgi:hypothetical protein